MRTLATVIPWLQIILAAILILSIVLQQSGAGVGGALGGTDGGIYHTRRGFEKFLFYVAIVTAVLFVASAVVAILL